MTYLQAIKGRPTYVGLFLIARYNISIAGQAFILSQYGLNLHNIKSQNRSLRSFLQPLPHLPPPPPPPRYTSMTLALFPSVMLLPTVLRNL